MNADTVERLELKIAFLERGHQELSDALYAQQRELERLAARIEALLSRLTETEGGPQRFDPQAERPPHY